MPKYKYQEIADSLRSRIGLGREFPPGAKLPTRRELCEQYEVSEITVDNAMRELRNEGLTETLHGVAVYVREDRQEPE